MQILITGGAGFIGSNLARVALAANPENNVRIIDDLSTGYATNLDGLDVEFVRGTILDEIALQEAMVGVDAVVHLAAVPSVPRSIKDPRRSHDANATGTLNVLEAARSEGDVHVTVASSSSVYGSNPSLPKREDAWTRPLSPYAATKLITEAYAIAYAHSFGMQTLAFRFFNVYGPGQAAGHSYAAVIPMFIDAALRGEPVVVHGDGLQSRDFTFVGTVCEALYRAASERVTSDSPVNLAFGTRTTLLELIDVISEAVGTDVAVEHVDRRAGDVFASQADGTLLNTLFPGVSSYTLEHGVRATVDWFLSARGAVQ